MRRSRISKFNGELIPALVHPSTNSDGDPVDALIRDGSPRVTLAERRQYEHLSNRDRFVKQHLKRLQPLAMSLRHSYGPPYEPGVPTSRIMIRGEYDHPGDGDVVEPGFLCVITGNQDPAPIRLDPFKRWPTRSRRTALADWIASAENPLTARVMVNRLWHCHFGQGIVRTPSDFGHLSGGPSHPELLDWLALKFVEEKWSVKAMHRLIVNSATYRQTSAHDNTEAAKVVDNEKGTQLFDFNCLHRDPPFRKAQPEVTLHPTQAGQARFPRHSQAGRQLTAFARVRRLHVATDKRPASSRLLSKRRRIQVLALHQCDRFLVSLPVVRRAAASGREIRCPMNSEIRLNSRGPNLFDSLRIRRRNGSDPSD